MGASVLEASAVGSPIVGTAVKSVTEMSPQAAVAVPAGGCRSAGARHSQLALRWRTTHAPRTRSPEVRTKVGWEPGRLYDWRPFTRRRPAAAQRATDRPIMFIEAGSMLREQSNPCKCDQHNP